MADNDSKDHKPRPEILFSYDELEELNKLNKEERYKLMNKIYMIRNFERIQELHDLNKEE